jgi:hypothetical protein
MVALNELLLKEAFEQDKLSIHALLILDSSLSLNKNVTQDLIFAKESRPILSSILILYCF